MGTRERDYVRSGRTGGPRERAENLVQRSRDFVISSTGAESNLHSTVLGIQQVQMKNQANQVRELQDRLHAKEMENIALRTGKRKAEEDDELIALPKKLRFTEDEDDAWDNINKSARMVRR